jgi:crossover junction endodeoxyribonuclease RuvC
MHSPDIAAYEDIFYARNVRATLQLGQARGSAIIAAINAGVPIANYSPREVKQALTGYGSASKEQVQTMVMQVLDQKTPISPLDASDALAVAICHINRHWTANTVNGLNQ